MALSKNQATALGCISPVLWGLSVSLIRTISQTIGIQAGLAITYTLGFILAIIFFKIPNLKRMPLKYYVLGIGSTLLMALSFAFSLAIARDGTQTMEVGMINYLWPALTIVFAVLFNKQPARWWLFIGVILAVYGIFMVLSGTLLVDFVSIYGHIKTNPLSYFLGLVAAVTWAAYSNFTKAWANGENPTVLVFGLEVILFNGLWIFDTGTPANFTWYGILVSCIMAFVSAGAYGLWTLGVQKGRINVMSIASYFTPVLSCIFASFIIGAQLNYAFWAGVAVVVLGSIICWLATRNA